MFCPQVNMSLHECDVKRRCCAKRSFRICIMELCATCVTRFRQNVNTVSKPQVMVVRILVASGRVNATLVAFCGLA
jgi:hypothetical protein